MDAVLKILTEIPDDSLKDYETFVVSKELKRFNMKVQKSAQLILHGSYIYLIILANLSLLQYFSILFVFATLGIVDYKFNKSRILKKYVQIDFPVVKSYSTYFTIKNSDKTQEVPFQDIKKVGLSRLGTITLTLTNNKKLKLPYDFWRYENFVTKLRNFDLNKNFDRNLSSNLAKQKKFSKLFCLRDSWTITMLKYWVWPSALYLAYHWNTEKQILMLLFLQPFLCFAIDQAIKGFYVQRMEKNKGEKPKNIHRNAVFFILSSLCLIFLWVQ